MTEEIAKEKEKKPRYVWPIFWGAVAGFDAGMSLNYLLDASNKKACIMQKAPELTDAVLKAADAAARGDLFWGITNAALAGAIGVIAYLISDKYKH